MPKYSMLGKTKGFIRLTFRDHLSGFEIIRHEFLKTKF